MAELADERINLCSKIKQARKDQKLTLVQASKHLGIDTTQLSKIENGKFAVSIDKIIFICRFYDLQLVI